MRTAAHQRRKHLQLAATIVACTILCLATTASAQPPAASVQGYTEITTGPGIRSLNLYRWSQSADAAGLNSVKNNRLVPEVASANGQVVAGSFADKSGYNHSVFVWSKAGGFKDIAEFSFWYSLSNVSFVSDDGSLVVWKVSSNKSHPKPPQLLRWTKARGVKELGTPGDSFSIDGVSADGSEIVGCATDHCFRWIQQAGFQTLAGMDKILGLSADGKVIIGTKADPSKALHVVRWTEVGGAQDIGTLKADVKTADVVIAVAPKAVSADGTTIVGSLSTAKKGDKGTLIPNADRAFLWTQKSGIQDLGDLGGKGAVLQDVSADGTVLMGNFSDASGTNIHFVSSVPDLMAKSQVELKREQEQAKAQAAAQAQEHAKAAAAKAEEDAKNAAIEADQQARYDKMIKKGRPIQMYSLAGDFEDEGRPDLAANLYQALIDKFPDDPYAAKAVAKKDAARAVAAQQQQAQAPAGQQVAANAPSPQAIEACHQQCSSTLNSCTSDAQNQHDAAVAKGLVGMISRNAGMMGGGASDTQSADNAKSACQDAYNSCSAGCQ
jgi:uncharacterized membrane protein